MGPSAGLPQIRVRRFLHRHDHKAPHSKKLGRRRCTLQVLAETKTVPRQELLRRWEYNPARKDSCRLTVRSFRSLSTPSKKFPAN